MRMTQPWMNNPLFRNTNTHKFHYPGCSSVKQMAEKNKQNYIGMRDEIMAMGYEQGYIGGVDDLLSDYLPQVVALEGSKKDLTLRHLLTQTSGLEWYEWGGGASNWAEFRGADNWVEYILGRRMVAQPGQIFNYSTGNTHLLAAAIEAATGKPLLEYGKEVLFDKLGRSV